MLKPLTVSKTKEYIAKTGIDKKTVKKTVDSCGLKDTASATAILFKDVMPVSMINLRNIEEALLQFLNEK